MHSFRLHLFLFELVFQNIKKIKLQNLFFYLYLSFFFCNLSSPTRPPFSFSETHLPIGLVPAQFPTQPSFTAPRSSACFLHQPISYFSLSRRQLGPGRQAPLLPALSRTCALHMRRRTALAPVPHGVGEFRKTCHP
jgi:hypothetical protein